MDVDPWEDEPSLPEIAAAGIVQAAAGAIAREREGQK